MTTETIPTLFVPLERAVLCAGCAAVFEINGHCPACGSATFLSLGRLLNREEKATL